MIALALHTPRKRRVQLVPPKKWRLNYYHANLKPVYRNYVAGCTLKNLRPQLKRTDQPSVTCPLGTQSALKTVLHVDIADISQQAIEKMKRPKLKLVVDNTGNGDSVDDSNRLQSWLEFTSDISHLQTDISKGIQNAKEIAFKKRAKSELKRRKSTNVLRPAFSFTPTHKIVRPPTVLELFIEVYCQVMTDQVVTSKVTTDTNMPEVSKSRVRTSTLLDEIQTLKFGAQIRTSTLLDEIQTLKYWAQRNSQFSSLESDISARKIAFKKAMKRGLKGSLILARTGYNMPTQSELNFVRVVVPEIRALKRIRANNKASKGIRSRLDRAISMNEHGSRAPSIALQRIANNRAKDFKRPFPKGSGHHHLLSVASGLNDLSLSTIGSLIYSLHLKAMALGNHNDNNKAISCPIVANILSNPTYTTDFSWNGIKDYDRRMFLYACHVRRAESWEKFLDKYEKKRRACIKADSTLYAKWARENTAKMLYLNCSSIERRYDYMVSHKEGGSTLAPPPQAPRIGLVLLEDPSDAAFATKIRADVTNSEERSYGRRVVDSLIESTNWVRENGLLIPGTSGSAWCMTSGLPLDNEGYPMAPLLA